MLPPQGGVVKLYIVVHIMVVRGTYSAFSLIFIDPLGRPTFHPVVIIVLTNVSIRNISKQMSLENNYRCWSGLWVWPRGSWMTQVL